MVQTVNLPDHNLDSDDLLIASITTERTRAHVGFTYRRRVQEILGPSIGSWAKFFLRLTQVPSFIDQLSVGEEVVLALLHTESEGVGLHEVMGHTTNACPFPADDLYPSDTLYPC
jgi:hypothetical protein